MYFGQEIVSFYQYAPVGGELGLFFKARGVSEAVFHCLPLCPWRLPIQILTKTDPALLQSSEEIRLTLDMQVRVSKY